MDSSWHPEALTTPLSCGEAGVELQAEPETVELLEWFIEWRSVARDPECCSPPLCGWA